MSESRAESATDGLSSDDPDRATRGPDESTPIGPIRGTEHFDAPVRELVLALEGIGRDVCELTSPLDDPQLNWRPAEGRWSIAECIGHLTLSGKLHLAAIDRAIERGMARQLLGGREFAPGWIGRWLIAEMEPPARRRLPTHGRLIPPAFEHRAPLIAGFEAMQRALIHRVIASNGLDLGRIRFSSPLVPLLWLPLGTWFAFLAAHERRHVWQAWQVREEDGFPE